LNHKQFSNNTISVKKCKLNNITFAKAKNFKEGAQIKQVFSDDEDQAQQSKSSISLESIE